MFQSADQLQNLQNFRGTSSPSWMLMPETLTTVHIPGTPTRGRSQSLGTPMMTSAQIGWAGNEVWPVPGNEIEIGTQRSAQQGTNDMAAMIRAEVKRQMREAKTHKGESESTDPSRYSHFWNINAMTVAYCKSMFCWPADEIWDPHDRVFKSVHNIDISTNAEVHSYTLHRNDGIWPAIVSLWWTFWLSAVPLAYLVLLICVLSGIMDEGLSTKTQILGDGYYQSWIYRFSSDATQRAKFQPKYDEVTGTKLGLTTQTINGRSLFKSRNSGEISACLDDELFVKLNAYDPKSGSYGDFWILIAELQKRDQPKFLFSHCLPWEYANLCATLMKANEKLTKNLQNDLPMSVRDKLTNGADVYTANGPWYTAACQPHNWKFKSQMTYEQWAALSTTTEDAKKSSETHLLPKKLEGYEGLAMWVLSYNMASAKTLDSNQGLYSTVLYHHSQYMYTFGYGEASLVEIIAIFVLNIYLYYSSVFSESAQLMEQILLLISMRPYEAVFFSDGPAMSANSAALRRSVVNANVPVGLGLVFSDFFCDVFMSLRILFMAFFTIACAMIVTLQHGVINVVLSILAMAFLVDIDDCFMKIYGSQGFQRTWDWTKRVGPALAAIIDDRVETGSSPPSPGLPWWRYHVRMLIGSVEQKRMPSMENDKRKKMWRPTAEDLPHSPSGQMIVQTWTLVLTTILLGLQQVFCLYVAIDGPPEKMKEVLNSVFLEFSGMPMICVVTFSVIYGCNFFMGLCYLGLMALPSLLQLGVCLIWVYAVLRNLTFLGVQAWYSDCRYGESFWDCFQNNVSADALLVFPALGVHVVLCVSRPLFIWMSFRNGGPPAPNPPAINKQANGDSKISKKIFEPLTGDIAANGNNMVSAVYRAVDGSNMTSDNETVYRAGPRARPPSRAGTFQNYNTYGGVTSFYNA